MLLPGNAITSMLHMSPSLVCAEIEELSARAGSFKPFITFTRMLKTALQGCSNTVDLDVLTLAGQMSTLSFPKADGRQAMQLVKLFSRYARGQNKVSISVCCQGRCQTSPSGLLPIGWCLARSCRGSTRDRAPMLVGKLHYKEDATNRLSSSLMMTNP